MKDNNHFKTINQSSINSSSLSNKLNDKHIQEAIENYSFISPTNKQTYSLSIEKEILEKNLQSISFQLTSLSQLLNLKNKELDILTRENELNKNQHSSTTTSIPNNKPIINQHPIPHISTKEEFSEEQAIDHKLIKKYDNKFNQKKREIVLNNEIILLNQKETFLKDIEDFRNKSLMIRNELGKELRALNSLAGNYISKEEHNYLIQKELKAYSKKKDSCTMKYKTMNKLYSSCLPNDNHSVTITDKSVYMTSLPNEKCLTLEGIDNSSPLSKKFMMRYPALQKKKIVFGDLQKTFNAKHKQFAIGKNLQLNL